MNHSAGSRPVARPPRFGERLTQEWNCADGSGSGAIPWPLTAGGSQLTVTGSRYGSEHLLAQDQECSRLVGVELRQIGLRTFAEDVRCPRSCSFPIVPTPLWGGGP